MALRAMSKMLLVGEAWGAREERFQHALVGPSGAELARMLAQMGIGPELPVKHPNEMDMVRYWRDLKSEQDIDVTNVFNFHPPNNNIEECFTSKVNGGLYTLPPLKIGKYLRPELLCHVEALWDRVREAQPNLVVAMGNTACWALLGETTISALRGTLKISKRLGVKVLPTYHPAAVLRAIELRPVVLKDLEKVRDEIECAEIRRIERWAIVDPTLAEVADWMTRPADYYAVDIETDPALPISMIGFARTYADALVVPFYDPRKPNGSYWLPSEEATAWRFVDWLLKRPVPKLFQNGVFDLFHLLRAGLRPTMCNHDTMILHHALYPEMLKGLGFLGSIYSNEIAWKPMRRKSNTLKRDE